MKRTLSTASDGPTAVKGKPDLARDPSPEAIAQRAYELYLARGQAHGRALEDWLEAERALRDSPR